MKLIMILALVMAFTGCRTKYGYMLDKMNAENAAKHPPVFDLVTVEGGEEGVTIGQGARVVIKTPTQPFVPQKFADEIEAQRGIVRDVVTGAVIGFGLHQAGHNSTTKTTVTGGAE